MVKLNEIDELIGLLNDKSFARFGKCVGSGFGQDRINRLEQG